MTSAEETESIGDLSQSWPDTELMGSLEESSPQSPALPVRREFSHYTQVSETNKNSKIRKKYTLGLWTCMRAELGSSCVP